MELELGLSGGRRIWIADARDDGKRFVVYADEKLRVFLEFGINDPRPGELPEDCAAREIKFDKLSQIT